jgi:flagellar hook protein FlgE
MSGSLLSGVSGLRAHQQLLDVVGNNLANINTPGYKSARASFSDLISQTLRAGNGPTAQIGGTNPSQLGLGVKLASVDQDLRQGSFQSTGRTLDLGIEGEGFFVVNDGKQNLYTRVGTFDLDEKNNLVASGTGFKVQAANGGDIVIDVNARMPARATSRVNFTGNLDAAALGPAATVLSSLRPFKEGTAARVTGTSAEPFALADGMTLSIRVDGRAAQTVTFRDDGTFANIGAATAAEIASAINAQTTGIRALDSGGALVLESKSTGTNSSLDIDDGTGSPAALLGLSTTLVFGTEAPATAATPLDAIPDNTIDYVFGDKINISGEDADGRPVSATFVFGTNPGQNGTTLGDLVNFLGTIFPATIVSLDADGTLRLTAREQGEANLRLVFNDDPANTGFTSFSSLPMVVTTPGSSGDTVRTAIDIFDTQGRKHNVSFLFRKIGANEWDVTVTIPPGEGTIVFNEDGSFNRVAGVGIGDPNFEILFDGLTATQTVVVEMGTSGKFDGLTQFGGSTTAGATAQDGFDAGSLSSLAVNQDGKIVGIYTNGQIQDLAQLQVATFPNPAGLLKVGDSMLAVTSNSGVALPGTALSGRAGKIVSGVIENSNVDIALEFTRLITAQRGFQVNARTITTTDQILQELANLAR